MEPASPDSWPGRSSRRGPMRFVPLFLHFRRSPCPRNAHVPLNTRSIAPNQPQQDVEFSGRFAAPDPG